MYRVIVKGSNTFRKAKRVKYFNDKLQAYRYCAILGVLSGTEWVKIQRKILLFWLTEREWINGRGTY